MSAMLKGRKSKAASLVPLALLSAAWTASIAGADSVASAAKNKGHALPDGSTIPSQAIQAPASVPVPGEIAPAVPDGAADATVAGASTSGIPSVALSAYQRAAQIIDAADTTCNVPWELIAAIGRVESDHGQYGGNTLNSNGIAEPGIYGPTLDGKNGTQKIMDTDGGQLDKDPVYDRAVGPMQFIPSTWASVKVDADGDGQRNPQDINDASLATGVYLCSGNENLGTRGGQQAAVFRYNHSQSYVDLVLRIMEAYSQGNFTALPSGTYGGSIFYPSAASTIKSRQQTAKAKAKQRPTAHSASSSTSSTGTATGTGGASSTGSSAPLANVDTTKAGSGGGLVGTVTGTLGGLTGSGSTSGGTTSSPSPSPNPVSSTLTLAQATLECTTKGLIAGTAAFQTCLASYGY